MNHCQETAVSFYHLCDGDTLQVLQYMGVPSIEAEEAATSSLLMHVPIALLPDRLPLHVIDRMHASKSRMRSMKAERVWKRSYGSSRLISMVM